MSIEKRATKETADDCPAMRSFFLGIVFTAGLLSQCFTAPALAQELKNGGDTPENFVNLLAGTGRSTSAYLADDMRSLFSSSEDFRLLPSIGDGDMTNIANILALDFIDLAFVHFNVLDYFADAGIDENIEEKLVYLAKTHNEEFHLLARADIFDLSMLNGKTVNIGPNVDGAYFTATEIFHAHDIDIVATTLPHLSAYPLLKSGEIDAMAIVDGSPSDLLKMASLDDGVRLLTVPMENLPDSYALSELNNEDYPKLFAAGDSVATVAVPTILIAYDWPEGSTEQAALDTFVEAFVEALPDLRSPDREFHPKWREADLWGVLPEPWRRHPRLRDIANPLKVFDAKSN